MEGKEGEGVVGDFVCVDGGTVCVSLFSRRCHCCTGTFEVLVKACEGSMSLED